MAKKAPSKHSRAARRAQAETAVGKELSKLPRVADKKDIANFIVRTTNKNEDLLKKKIEKTAAQKEDSKIRKTSKAGITKANNNKVNRALAIGGKLNTKIQKSINRAMAVQRRKTTWDQINLEIRKSDVVQNSPLTEGSKKDGEEEMDIEDSGLEESDDEEKKDKLDVASHNAFALLEEVEA